MKIEIFYRCPICKSENLIEIDNKIQCKNCNSFYSIEKDYINFLPFYNTTLPDPLTKQWKELHLKFREWVKNWNRKNYDNDCKADDELYKNIKLTGKVLDVGCFCGLIRKYTNNNCEYYGIDVDNYLDGENAIIFSKQCDDLVWMKPFTFSRGFAEYLPYKEDYFDTIHYRSVIDHFFNINLALSEAVRVLKNNGTIVIGTTLDDCTKTLENYTEGHCYSFDEKGIIMLLEEKGFIVESIIPQKEYKYVKYFIGRLKK